MRELDRECSGLAIGFCAEKCRKVQKKVSGRAWIMRVLTKGSAACDYAH